MSKNSKIRFQNLLTKDEEEEIKALEAGRVKFEKEVIKKYWREGFNAMHDSKGFHATAAEPQLGPNNIVGVGLAEQIRGGRYTGKLAITVYTITKATPDQIMEEYMMPPTFDGLPVDVVEAGFNTIQPERAITQLVHLDPRQRHRPTICGSSIGHYTITAGTLGAVCTRPNEDKLIISNNHVLAASNNAEEGDDILQPGAADFGQRTGDKIAELLDFVPLKFDGQPNRVDAALAKPTVPLESISPEINDIGRVNGIAGIVPNHTRVQKSGRTTGQTSGTIEGINASFTVNYREAGQALLTGLYVIKPFPGNPPFSAGGDSGSLILDNANRAVAILFAGSTLQTLAIPISTVMEDLRLDAIL